jgi:hypothetical protein
MNKEDVFICDCHSPDHQMVVMYDDDVDETNNKRYPRVYLYVHLNKKSFWQRLKYGVKYILGRQCGYGAFDEFIVNPDDVFKFEKIVEYLKKDL